MSDPAPGTIYVCGDCMAAVHGSAVRAWTAYLWQCPTCSAWQNRDREAESGDQRPATVARPRPRTATGAAIVAALLLVLATPSSAAVGVVDGDTLSIGSERVRLWGIDAPEMRQTCYRRDVAFECGREARRALLQIIRGRDVTCTPVARDRYGRTVARCRAAGDDLGSEMARAGWALDYTRYSGGRYAADQTAAQQAQRGLWAPGVTFTAPWEWRKRR